MHHSKKFVKRSLMLWQNKYIFNICKRYIDLCNGDNNGDMASNGELHLIEKYIPKSKIVFDVGANVGLWSESVLTLNQHIELHCFEPNLFAYEKLVKQLSSYSENVIINNFALGSSPDEKLLYIFDEGSPLNSLWKRKGLESYGHSTPRTVEKVKIGTLSNYCSENHISNIDFIKIDVEGHELEVIKGGRELFENQRVNMIQFEYGGTYLDSRTFLRDVFEFFSDLNYSFYKLFPFPKLLAHVSSYDVSYENFQYSNWIVIRNGWKIN